MVIRMTELAEIEDRANRASEAPWSHLQTDAAYSTIRDASQEDIAHIGASLQDGDFIEHAREDVPRLVAEVRDLNERIQRIVGFLANDVEYVEPLPNDPQSRIIPLINNMVASVAIGVLDIINAEPAPVN